MLKNAQCKLNLSTKVFVQQKTNFTRTMHGNIRTYAFIWIRMLDVNERIDEKMERDEMRFHTAVAGYRTADHKRNGNIIKTRTGNKTYKYSSNKSVEKSG
jgi:hypothetical protein